MPHQPVAKLAELRASQRRADMDIPHLPERLRQPGAKEAPP